jgi:predicted ester cyclase
MGILRWTALAGLVAGCATGQASRLPGDPIDPTVEANQRAFRRLVEAWASGDAETVGSLVTSGYVGHVAAGDRDAAGLKRRVSEFASLYTVVHFRVEDQFSSGDRVATRMTIDAVERSSGRRVRLMGINISRFEGEKVAEEWNTWERLAAEPASPR